MTYYLIAVRTFSFNSRDFTKITVLEVYTHFYTVQYFIALLFVSFHAKFKLITVKSKAGFGQVLSSHNPNGKKGNYSKLKLCPFFVLFRFMD